MNKLVEETLLLRRGIEDDVNNRIDEFKKLGKENIVEIFKELSFCLLTANYSAAGGIRIQKEIGEGFLTLTRKKLGEKLRELGHRFPVARADYIIRAREKIDNLEEILNSSTDENFLRDWIVENIKGIGYKEASHFLRNIGYDNFAIIDFHIIDILVRYEIITRPKTLTKRKYLEIESILRDLSEKIGMNLSKLDLYLWYKETGKLLK